MAEVSYRGVVLGAAGVEERRHGRRMVFVPRADVRALRFERGWRAERPILQLAFAAVFVVAGLALCATNATALWDGRGHTSPRVLIMGVFVLGFGVVVAALALRRGAFVRVTTAAGSRKLLFDGDVDHGEIGALLDGAAQLGYDVTAGEVARARARPRAAGR